MALRTAPALPLRWLHRLTTPLLPDDYLELVDPLWSQRTLNARIVNMEKETRDATTLTLEAPARWDGHQPGQYIRLGVSVDGVRHSRCYSISSSHSVNTRSPKHFQVTVKSTENGRVSQHLNQRARVGDVLEISQAEGDFCWPALPPERALFISAGSGITPLMSLARWAAAEGRLPSLTWLHYAPTAADVIFSKALRALADAHPQLHLQIILTREGGSHFSTADLEQRCPDWQQRPTWSCGPAALLDQIEALWAGTPAAAALTVERFRAKTLPVGEAHGGTVRFLRTGGCADSDGATNLLETAEAAGLLPAHGCRMGICHGCTVKLKSGQVRDLRTGQRFGEEDDLIQICVCAPAGDIDIEL